MWLLRCVTPRNLETPQQVVSSAGSTVCVRLYLAVNAVVGGGTVGVVASRMGRPSIMIEKEAGYCDEAKARLSSQNKDYPEQFSR